jgi:hypothetical protein
VSNRNKDNDVVLFIRNAVVSEQGSDGADIDQALCPMISDMALNLKCRRAPREVVSYSNKKSGVID